MRSPAFMAFVAFVALGPSPDGFAAPDPGACGPEVPATPAQKVPAPVTPLRIGLALGSGSMHGLAHIGVVQELEARGLDVRIVTGTSVGAVIGGLWASGQTGSAIETLSEGSDWEDVGRFAASFQGLFSNDGLRKQLETLFGGRPMEAWPRRFGAVATDAASGHRRLLRRGDGATAIQASSAVPVMFLPVRVASENLIDGALVEPVPIASARVLGAQYVIAVDVAYRPYEEAASGLSGFAFQAMHILINSLSAEQLRGADFALRLDLHHRLMSCGSRSLIQAGREATRKAWPEIVRSIQAKTAATSR